MIPIAVFPAPGPGGGREITFQNEQGLRIRDDGLMIVHRSEILAWCLASIPCAPSNHVVRVHEGGARVPQDWTLASVSLNSFGLGVAQVSILHKAPQAVVMVLISLPPVWPMVNPGYNDVFILPLIPGYHPIRRGQTAEKWAHRYCVFREYVYDCQIHLRRNADHPEAARAYWQDCLKRLRRRYEKPTFESGPDLRLETDDYFKVKAFIERELASIRVPPPATQPTE